MSAAQLGCPGLSVQSTETRDGVIKSSPGCLEFYPRPALCFATLEAKLG